MVTSEYIDQQLKKLHKTVPFWVKPELHELQHILVEGETIEQILNGRYEGGFALLCATNFRVLLIDKKPFYLTLEDIRYEKMVEIDFSYRMIDATVTLCTPGRKLAFTSMRRSDARAMTHYIQSRILELRQLAWTGTARSEPLAEEAAATPALANALPQQAVVNLTQLQPFTPVASDEDSSQSRLPAIFLPKSVRPYLKTAVFMRRRPSRFHKASY